MINRLKTRLGSEQGFTLIELLVVIIILGILLAIAVPSYLSFKDRADKSAAQANVRAVLPDVESYNADNVPGGTADPNGVVSAGPTPPYNGNLVADPADSGYHGMTKLILKTQYDQAFPNTVWVASTDGSFPAGLTAFVAATATDYCVVSQSGNWYGYKHGPGGLIKATSDPAAVCT